MFNDMQTVEAGDVRFPANRQTRFWGRLKIKYLHTYMHVHWFDIKRRKTSKGHEMGHKHLNYLIEF